MGETVVSGMVGRKRENETSVPSEDGSVRLRMGWSVSKRGQPIQDATDVTRVSRVGLTSVKTLVTIIEGGSSCANAHTIIEM